MKILGPITLVLLFVAMSGCATNSALMERGSTNTRNDIFVAVAKGMSLPPGYSRLRVFASLKTLRSHAISLVVNVDGQVIRIPATSREENRDSFNVRDPEEGIGFRHSFLANLQLKPGYHRVIATIPEKGIVIEKEINVDEGENSFHLIPRYRSNPPRRSAFFAGTSFKEGIIGFDIELNGHHL